jgi:hypothetical protein
VLQASGIQNVTARFDSHTTSTITPPHTSMAVQFISRIQTLSDHVAKYSSMGVERPNAPAVAGSSPARAAPTMAIRIKFYQIN